jgi:hypothetical protein
MAEASPAPGEEEGPGDEEGGDEEPVGEEEGEGAGAIGPDVYFEVFRGGVARLEVAVEVAVFAGEEAAGLAVAAEEGGRFDAGRAPELVGGGERLAVPQDRQDRGRSRPGILEADAGAGVGELALPVAEPGDLLGGVPPGPAEESDDEEAEPEGLPAVNGRRGHRRRMAGGWLLLE